MLLSVVAAASHLCKSATALGGSAAESTGSAGVPPSAPRPVACLRKQGL